MGYKESFELWKSNPYFDQKDRDELLALTDEKEIEDRFYKDLEFGTAGLRGILGVGSNRMNKYNIRRATTGFALYLLEKYGEEAKKKGIAIAYDCRNFSKEFAKETALTMCKHGIPAYLYEMISATPLLSWSVRAFDCVGGVVVTASHNPAEYNGYKVYDETGCQIGEDTAAIITKKIESLDITKLTPATEEDGKGLLKMVGRDEQTQFIHDVEKQAGHLTAEEKAAVKIVYTPLHGAGKEPVQQMFKEQGFTNYSVVEAQCVQDGNFPTVKSPNPEEASALAMAIEQAKKEDADIVIATDPDSDRVGIAVKHNGEFVLFNGNQTGAMMTNYIMESRKDILDENSFMIKTIVTSEMAADIAKKKGYKTFDTLTGFKNICAVMNRELAKGYKFIIGYEESYGYLVGEHARDKDAVLASMIIAEMAAFYKAQGKDLVQVKEDLYKEYGFYFDKCDSYYLKGKEGAEKIKSIMEELRKLGSSFAPKIVNVKDYSLGIDGIPKSNVLKFYFESGSWLAARPSGTEPKIKFYYAINEADEKTALKSYEDLKAVVDKVVNA